MLSWKVKEDVLVEHIKESLEIGEMYADKVIVNSYLVLPPEFHEPCGFYEPPG